MFSIFVLLFHNISPENLCELGLEKETEIYIWSAPNKSNETYIFMCLGSAKTAL